MSSNNKRSNYIAKGGQQREDITLRKLPDWIHTEVLITFYDLHWRGEFAFAYILRIIALRKVCIIWF